MHRRATDATILRLKMLVELENRQNQTELTKVQRAAFLGATGALSMAPTVALIIILGFSPLDLFSNRMVESLFGHVGNGLIYYGGAIIDYG